LRKLLAINDQIEQRCFSPPQRKGDLPGIYENGALSFLHSRVSNWSSRWSSADWSYNCETLIRHWLSTLVDLVIGATWLGFHEDYARLIEPWVPEVDGAAVLFAKIPWLGKCVTSSKQVSAQRSAWTTEELASFMDIYQRLRQVRAKALADELHNLATLYDAHPTRLRTPFSPQTRRPNASHIPANMRAEARRLVRVAENKWWNPKTQPYRYRFRFAFPGLVQYDWGMRFINTVLKKHPMTTSGELYPIPVMKKCWVVLNVPPKWVEGQDGIVDLTKAFGHLGVGMEALRTPAVSNAYRPHRASDIDWLLAFLEVVEWMEDAFPDMLQKARGADWDTR
jgi:hypothetical protein